MMGCEELSNERIVFIFRLNPPDLSDTAKLPLVIREKDVVYQVSFNIGLKSFISLKRWV